MNDRRVLLDVLAARLSAFSDAALVGMLDGILPLVCPICGTIAARRDCWQERDGIAYVYLACRRPGCGWRATRIDPSPPDRQRKPRQRAHPRKMDISIDTLGSTDAASTIDADGCERSTGTASKGES
jgi:hypothetical protein